MTGDPAEHANCFTRARHLLGIVCWCNTKGDSKVMDNYLSGSTDTIVLNMKYEEMNWVGYIYSVFTS